MRRDVKQYWDALLKALHDLSERTISFEEYRERLSRIRSELSNKAKEYFTLLPFDYIPLLHALSSAGAEVSPYECEQGEDVHDIAHWFYKQYTAIFVEKRKAYFEDERLFGGNYEPVYLGVIPPEPVRSLIVFEEKLSNRGVLTLSPSDIRFLHALYLHINPDTILGYLSMEALRALLPWLECSIVDEVRLTAYENQTWAVPEERLARFREWMSRLKGERVFRVQLVYYKENIIIRID